MVPVPRLGPYELNARIHLSASAEVFEATHVETGQKVSIKRLLPHALEDRELSDHFRNEVRLALRSRHPGLVRGLEVVEAPSPEGASGELCLVMEFIEGRPLSDILEGAQGAPAPSPVLVHVAYTLASILEGLHTRSEEPLVHGDISAKNIMVGDEGQLSVVDLGSLVAAGALSRDAGTPRYVAPERAHRSAPMTPAVDMYGIGVCVPAMDLE